MTHDEEFLFTILLGHANLRLKMCQRSSIAFHIRESLIPMNIQKASLKCHIGSDFSFCSFWRCITSCPSYTHVRDPQVRQIESSLNPYLTH